MKITSLLYACLIACPSICLGWDPIGDITHPDRILRNIGRELDNAGQQIDRARLEANAHAGAPAMEAWLHQSRNTSIRGSSRIPWDIRQAIEGFINDRSLLDNVRYRIGDSGTLNLANLSISYGHASAVTLIDVIVFKNRRDAETNLSLWVHELRHVKQFRDWGVRDFSIRYLRSWNSVEDDAYSYQEAFNQWYDRNHSRQANDNSRSRVFQGDSIYQRRPTGPPSRRSYNASPTATRCLTAYGFCNLSNRLHSGAQCICQTPYGQQFFGTAR